MDNLPKTAEIYWFQKCPIRWLANARMVSSSGASRGRPAHRDPMLTMRAS